MVWAVAVLEFLGEAQQAPVVAEEAQEALMAPPPVVASMAAAVVLLPPHQPQTNPAAVAQSVSSGPVTLVHSRQLALATFNW
jgi:hypothetical protein